MSALAKSAGSLLGKRFVNLGSGAGRDDAKRNQFDRNVKANTVEPLMRLVETFKYLVDRPGCRHEFGGGFDSDFEALLLVT